MYANIKVILKSYHGLCGPLIDASSSLWIPADRTIPKNTLITVGNHLFICCYSSIQATCHVSTNREPRILQKTDNNIVFN